MQFARQPKIEVGKVDQHRRVRTPPFRLGHDFAKQPEDARQMFDHFRQPHHRDLVGVDHQLASGLLHPLAAHAKKLQLSCFRMPDSFLRAPRSTSRRKLRPKPLPPR